MDERTAYSDSSRRSEQLSYRKHFHPSYGLKDMNFQSLFEFLDLFNLTEKNMTSALRGDDVSSQQTR